MKHTCLGKVMNMLYFFVAVLVCALDQLTKGLIQSRLHPFQSFKIIDGFFSITYVKNFGAAFGIFYERTFFLISVTILVFVLIWLNRHQLVGYPRLCQLGLACALGGAAGNFLDRLLLGYVVDFFELPHWPVFNVADTGIVIGVGLIVLGVVRDELTRFTKSSKHSLTEDTKMPEDSI